MYRLLCGKNPLVLYMSAPLMRIELALVVREVNKRSIKSELFFMVEPLLR
jgi:hypothetical protein